MSTFRETRRLALAALVTTAALSTAASSAQAATSTLNLQCKFPLIGIQPVTLQLDADLPATAQAGSVVGPIAIAQQITLGGQVSLAAPLIGATSVEGTASTRGTVNYNGSTITIALASAFGPDATPDVDNPVVINANTTTPALTFDDPGTAAFSVENLGLNLTWRNADGDAIQIAPLRTDINMNPVVDSDGNTDTTDVYCRTAVAGETASLGSISIVSTPIGPVPSVTKVTGPKPKAGVGGQVHLQGANLGSTTQVAVDGVPATFTVQGQGLKVQLPALPAGSHSLVVTNANGASAPFTVTYQ